MYLPSLQDRAVLAVNCLTTHCDPLHGRLPWFYTRLADRPPTAILSTWSYGDGLGRTVDALVLLRHMTGDPPDHAGDREMIRTLLALIEPDGLSWCPPAPWTMEHAHTRPAWLQQGTLLALTSLFQVTGDEQYLRTAERNIDAIDKMARHHDGGWSDFPGDHYTREAGWAPPSTDLMHRFSAFSTSVNMPLMRYFRLTGYEPALRLASGLIAWTLRDHDGGTDLFERGHFHAQSRVVTALLLRGAATGSAADLELGESLYLKARSLGTRSGWFPEQVNNPDRHRDKLSETCCLTDMLESAILLARHRDPRYWDDVERYTRNHLLVHQIVDVGWFDELTFSPDEGHVMGGAFESLRGAPGFSTGPHLRRSLVGGFAGWGGVTAMSDDSMFSNLNQHCCNAAGARALYDAWRYAVDDDDRAGVFRVNLHLHRAHAAADVTVQERQDAVVLHVRLKKERRVVLRVPDFARPDQVRASVEGADRGVAAAGPDAHFVDVGAVNAGQTLVAVYPTTERRTTETVKTGTFEFRWRGATVVDAGPVQKVRPLFVPGRFSPHAPRLSAIAGPEIESL